MSLKQSIALGVACLIISGLASCSNVGQENRRRLMQLKLGMSRPDAVNVMGIPHKTEGAQTNQGKRYEILFYGTGGSLAPNSVSTPLVFENDRLVGWGQNYYQTEILKNTSPTTRSNQTSAMVP